MHSTRLAAFIVSTIVLTGTLSNAQEATSLTVGKEPLFISFSQLPEDSSPQGIFGEQLPGSIAWGAASRVVTADAQPVLGSYFDTKLNTWRGTLKTLDVNRGYWLVIPPEIAPLTITLTGAQFTAGTAKSLGGVMVTIDGGTTSVTPSAPPQSTATHEIVKEKPTTITASSGVYIQNEPGTDSDGTQPSVAWVKVPLDSAYAGFGAESAQIPVPLAGSGVVTVAPPPDFSVPPWGRGPIPGE